MTSNLDMALVLVDFHDKRSRVYRDALTEIVELIHSERQAIINCLGSRIPDEVDRIWRKTQ